MLARPLARPAATDSMSLPMRRSRAGGFVFALAALVAVGAAPYAEADLIVPANSSTTLSAGTLDLACTDLVVAGTLRVATGRVINVRNVSIQPGGTIVVGSGTIALGGNWSNSGTLAGGAGTVHFRDLCSVASTTISGNSVFATVSFVSAIGKTYVFAAGTTQSMTAGLEIAGTVGRPIAFRSSVPGQVASVNLLAGGTQRIDHVGVTDVWATGQWLAPGQTNAGGGGNARRWFGDPGGSSSPTPIPAFGAAAQAALSIALAVFAGAALRRRRRPGAVDR